MQYPKTIAAARKAKGAEWALADALLAEVGRRGSEARFAECQAELADAGIDYTAAYLMDLHRVARTFPQGARAPWLTPRVAADAGTPAVVEKAIELKKEAAREQGTPYTPPSKRELAAARKQITHHARIAEGGTKRPTKQAIQSSARATTSELRRQADSLGLLNTVEKAKRAGRDFLRAIQGTTITAAQRRALLEGIDSMLETWAWARDAVENPLADEIAEYLSSL